MNFTQFDMKIMAVSAFTLLLLSAVAGATPMAGDFGDMPTFETNAELELEIPEQPGPDVSTQGSLQSGPNATRADNFRRIVNTDNRIVNVDVQGYDPANNSTSVLVTVGYENRSGSNTTITTASETMQFGDNVLIEVEDIGIEFTYSEQTDEYATIEYDIAYHPSFNSTGDNSGGLWAALSNISEWIGYIGQLIAFIAETIFAAIVFVFTGIVDVAAYIFGLIGWLTGGFGSMISSAPVWASPFVALPVLLMGMELMKLIMVIVEIFWI